MANTVCTVRREIYAVYTFRDCDAAASVSWLVSWLVGQMVGFAGLHLLVVFACWCVRSDCVGISYRHVRVSPPVTNYDRCVQFDLLWVCSCGWWCHWCLVSEV